MKIGLSICSLFLFSLLISACSQMELKPGSIERGIASVEPRKTASTHVQSCDDAHKAAARSPSIATVNDATNICQNASTSFCTALVSNSSDGAESDDGRYIAAACQLTAAYGANIAVNQGHATPKCESSYKTASQSSSTDDVESATDVCNTEQNLACINQVDKEGGGTETGDSRLVGAVCQMNAAHGAFAQVTKKK